MREDYGTPQVEALLRSGMDVQKAAVASKHLLTDAVYSDGLTHMQINRPVDEDVNGFSVEETCAPATTSMFLLLVQMCNTEGANKSAKG